MITKHDLRNFRSLRIKIRLLREQIDELSETMIVPATAKITGMPMSPSADHDKIANSLALMEKLTAQYEYKLKKCLEEQAYIESAVETLYDDEQNLIRLYYFRGLPWEKVCCYMHCSWTTVHRHHKRILEKLRSS